MCTFFTWLCLVFFHYLCVYTMYYHSVKRKSMYKSDADRGQWKSSRSPPGSRSRSAELSPRRGRWGKMFKSRTFLYLEIGFSLGLILFWWVFFVQVAGRWQCAVRLLYISCNLSWHLQNPVFCLKFANMMDECIIIDLMCGFYIWIFWTSRTYREWWIVEFVLWQYVFNLIAAVVWACH